MKILKTNRRVLTWFCVFPPEENATKWKKRAYIAFGVLIFAINLVSCIPDAAFFFKFVSIDLQKALMALLQLFGNAGMAYQIMVAFILREKIVAIIESLTKIYEINSKQDSFKFLVRVNNISEWMWMMFFKFFIPGGIVTNCTFISTSVLICWWFNGGFISEYMYRPFAFLLPWDQHTPLGYFGEICYSVLNGAAYGISGSFIFLFISACQHHEAFFQMLQHSLGKLGRADGNRNDKKFLCELIRFHVSARDFFMESADAFSLFLLVQLISAMLMLSIAVFQLDLIFQHIDFNIAIVLLVITFTVLTLFLYCYFGKIATESHAKMADCLFEANWQVLPVDLQKYFVLMIRNAQRPLYYHGFGVAVMNLETFTKLLRAVGTYYMMFKTFAMD